MRIAVLFFFSFAFCVGDFIHSPLPWLSKKDYSKLRREKNAIL